MNAYKTFLLRLRQPQPAARDPVRMTARRSEWVRVIAATTTTLIGSACVFGIGAEEQQDRAARAASNADQAQAPDRTITIVAEEMSFEPSHIRVRKGTTVRFVIRNEGDVRHEFVIGDVAAHAGHAIDMRDGAHAEHATDATSLGVSVPPGATRRLSVRFRSLRDLTYVCHVPGHLEAGMVGHIEIR